MGVRVVAGRQARGSAASTASAFAQQDGLGFRSARRPRLLLSKTPPARPSDDGRIDRCVHQVGMRPVTCHPSSHVPPLALPGAPPSCPPDATPPFILPGAAPPRAPYQPLSKV
eukprot:18506-Chlamydomonas_euryale.AAC.3